MTPAEPATSHASAAASLLRHDLITPINHILGFCELLIDDAEEKGRIYRGQSLRSIRAYGKQALGAVDRAVAHAVDSGRPADLSTLARALHAPTAAISEACDALEETSRAVPDRVVFLDDLAKIRQAAARLVIMAGQMSATSTATPGRSSA